MANKTYKVVANRTAADVVKNNDIPLETGYTLEEARIASLEYQRQGGHVAVWIEEEKPPKTPRIARTIERDHRGNCDRVTRCDGWMV